MPLTLLLGVSPGGFGTGEADDNNWTNIVQSEQGAILVPALEDTYAVLFATPDFKNLIGDATWQVIPVPLKQKTESDQAEIQNKQANTDKIYIDAGVLDAEEIAQSRFGKGEFTLHTTLDADTRKEFADTKDAELEESADANGKSEEIGAEGEAEKPADAAMNGAQVTGLIDIVSKVVSKELPKNSAIAILQVAYLLSPEDAAAVIANAEEFGEENAPEEEMTEGTLPTAPLELEEKPEEEGEPEEVEESGEEEEGA
jgi:hypothetical protein